MRKFLLSVLTLMIVTLVTINCTTETVDTQIEEQTIEVVSKEQAIEFAYTFSKVEKEALLEFINTAEHRTTGCYYIVGGVLHSVYKDIYGNWWDDYLNMQTMSHVHESITAPMAAGRCAFNQ